MTASQKTVRPRGRPLRDVPIEPEVMRRPTRPTPDAEQKAPPRQKVRKRSPAAAVLTVVLLLLIACVLFWLVAGVFSAMLKLETVTVEWPDGKSAVVSDEAVTAAAGLEIGRRLYAIHSGTVEAAVLRANPYLASVQVEHRLPDTVAIICRAREAAFYIEAAGEWFAISPDLTVLEQSREEAVFADRGLVHLILPEIRHALVGQKLSFTEEIDPAYLPALLEVHRASGLYAETDLLRIDSRFAVRMIVRGSYALTLGSDEDAALKLTLAEKILADSTFSANTGAFLDLSNPAESSAILDKQTDYSVLWRD